jgi:hypothetical protein
VIWSCLLVLAAVAFLAASASLTNSSASFLAFAAFAAASALSFFSAASLSASFLAAAAFALASATALALSSASFFYLAAIASAIFLAASALGFTVLTPSSTLPEAAALAASISFAVAPNWVSAVLISKAREHFRFTKAYAIKTAENQFGATAEEIKAAKAAASGKVDDGVKEVKPSADAAKKIADAIAAR